MPELFPKRRKSRGRTASILWRLHNPLNRGVQLQEWCRQVPGPRAPKHRWQLWGGSFAAALKRDLLKVFPEAEGRSLEAQLLVNEKSTDLGLEHGGKKVSLKLNLILVLESSEFPREVTPSKAVLGEQAEKKLTLWIKNYLGRKEQIISSEEVLMKGHLLEREGRAELRVMILTRSSPGWYFLNGKLLTDRKGKPSENSASQRPSCDFDLRAWTVLNPNGRTSAD